MVVARSVGKEAYGVGSKCCGLISNVVLRSEVSRAAELVV